MKSNIKSYNDLYKINKLETAKFKYNADFLLYYFDVKLAITLKLKKTTGKNCSSDIKYARNNLFNGYILTIYIPATYTSCTYNSNGKEFTINTLHDDMTLVLLEAIFTIKKPDAEFQTFVYNKYMEVDSIIRELKIKMVFEDD